MRMPQGLQTYTVDEVIETLPLGEDRKIVTMELMQVMPNAYQRPVEKMGKYGVIEPDDEEFLLSKIWNKLSPNIQSKIVDAYNREFGETIKWLEDWERENRER